MGERCKARYPGVDAHDYLRVVSLLEAIAESPTKENYLRYFKIMDQSWTWDYKGDIPFPETWFLEHASARTFAWPAEVFLQTNPWITYARLLEEYADQFARDAEEDVRIPASLLQAAWVYDVLSTKESLMVEEEDVLLERRHQLQSRATATLEHYLELYYDREDIPPEFCRYYRREDNYPATYNNTQDCVIEWLALLDVGVHHWGNTTERYVEEEVIAMQTKARNLVERYPKHHLANNLLNWIAWGYCYRANMYPIISREYIQNYRNALLTYQELLEQYPYGEMADNARQNIPIIEEKLRDPKARRAVPEGRWTWDVAEKPAPRLEEVFRMLLGMD